MVAFDFSPSLHRHGSTLPRAAPLPRGLLHLAEKAPEDAGLGRQVPPPVNGSCLPYRSSTQQKKSHEGVH